MRFKDTFGFALNNLFNRGIRSWLTILGIVIGISAVVAIVSLGLGLQASVSQQLGSLGADIVTISPGASRASSRGGAFEGGRFGGGSNDLGGTEGTLTPIDEKMLESIPGVKYVNGVVSGRGEISYLNEEAQVSIQGVRPEVWREMVTTEPESGRLLIQGDYYSAVIGTRVANQLFKQPIQLNSQITIEGRTFKVVGILAPSLSGSEDSQIFIPRDTAVAVLEDMNKDEFTSIAVQLKDGSNISEISQKIEAQLIISHRILPDKKDFTIRTPQAIQTRIQETTQTMTYFLGGIAGVSLLVGAIGIANTMFMSVMERTRQIGTLKALGMTNGEVMLAFLLESGLMGFVGGILGILFGLIFSGLISNVGLSFFRGRGGTTSIPLWLVVFALVFSLITGIISGVFPAKRAASLQPVEALRYE